MTEVALPGLDGGSLLGFVAGLGVLEALEATRSPGEPVPRLAWRRSSTWFPVVNGVSSLDEVVARLLLDSRSRAVEDVLSFRYLKVEKKGTKQVRALAAPVAVLRAALASRVSRGEWRTADTLAALMCESATDATSEDRAPSPSDLVTAGIEYDPDFPLDQLVTRTPFDFTSRNTQFLDQLARIREGLTSEAIGDDVTRGVGSRSDRIMRWDALVDTPWALFGGVAPMTRPAAEWLFFRGTGLFPLVGEAGRVRMFGLSGRRKAGEFSWILWDRPFSRDLVRTALGLQWSRMGRSQRTAHGAATGFVVSLRKDATGYDGAVSPSRPLPMQVRR